MKFKIVQPEQEKKKPDPVTTLELRQDIDGSVDVIATDAEGIEYAIVSFLSDGKLFRYASAGSGFRTNKNGQIINC